MGDIDRMDETLEAIQAEVAKDPPTTKVDAFFKLLKASEDPLHEHTEVTLLDFITRMMAIKSEYFFSNNCYNDLVKLISDMRRLTSVYTTVCFFWKEHAMRRSAESVVNQGLSKL
jgi:hypothetical protein